jgi:hypothetical protein
LDTVALGLLSPSDFHANLVSKNAAKRSCAQVLNGCPSAASLDQSSELAHLPHNLTSDGNLHLWISQISGNGFFKGNSNRKIEEKKK